MADDRVNELIEQLENGIKETLNGERYKAFLKLQSQFHSYSFNNAMLIYLQRPDATRVAGFQTWKNNFERHVMKGEKGISILAPCPYKYERPVKVINKETGKEETQTRMVEGLSCRRVTVFDVKQTEGKPLPEICNELQGNSESAARIIKAVKELSDIPVIEKAITSGAKGYYSWLENIIVIKEGMPLDQSAKTHVHEFCHSRIHSQEVCKTLDRATIEVQAESVAYIVCNRFGLDTSEYSFEYLANWSSGKELKELKQSFDIIQKTASDIIEKMEKVINKNLELQQSPAKVEILWSESQMLWNEIGKIIEPKFSDLNWKPDNDKPVIIDFSSANRIFESIETKAREMKTVNGEFQFGKPMYGTDGPLYEKTKFQVHLQDGRTIEARFDFGDGQYKNLAECIKKECGVDIPEYMKQHEQKQLQAKEVISNTVLEKIKDLYKAEFPAIVHITEKTARIIDYLNHHKGTTMSIEDIKGVYKETGKRVEPHNDKSDIEDFKLLKDVVDDLKHAQLTMKKEIAQQKASSNQIDRSRDMELAH
jgi:hypothetical protein